MIVMEATGHYWLSLFSSLIEDGYNVSVYNPFHLLSLKQLINQLVAFAGIDPSSNQSGNSASVNEKTSKRGSPYLRDFYDRKRAEGKHHFVAMAGVQRKLLGIIWFVLFFLLLFA